MGLYIVQSVCGMGMSMDKASGMVTHAPMALFADSCSKRSCKIWNAVNHISLLMIS